MGIYVVKGGQEQPVTTAPLDRRVRLKMIVVVTNAPHGGVPVLAIWEVRGIPQGKVFLRKPFKTVHRWAKQIKAQPR